MQLICCVLLCISVCSKEFVKTLKTVGNCVFLFLNYCFYFFGFEIKNNKIIMNLFVQKKLSLANELEDGLWIVSYIQVQFLILLLFFFSISYKLYKHTK